MIKRPNGTPIVVQVAGLVLACVAAAQAIALGIVLLAPPPAPPDTTLHTVADAIGGIENDRLSVSLLDEPPMGPTPQIEGHPAAIIAKGLSDLLNVNVADIRVSLVERPALASVPQTPTVPIVVIPPRQGQASPPPSVSQLMIDGHVKVPPFTAAIRQSDSKWLVVSQMESWISPWQARILIVFLLTILALAPIVWLASRLLTRPIRMFAEAAETFGLNPAAQPLSDTAGPSEVRSAVMAFNRMQDRLRRHLADRTAMAAAMAHDLRTPLTSLRFRAEFASDDVRDRMIQDIERLNTMISQVLAFVRGEQVREKQERIDISELVTACMHEIAETGAEISWHVEPGLAVMGEPINLRRSVTNLVDNAIKFGGKADVTLSRSGNRIVFRVEDEGPGVPEAKLEEVFEPFQRIESSRSRATGGIGLGLAQVRTVVHAHGGDVVLNNLNPKGLRAQVSLPAI